MEIVSLPHFLHNFRRIIFILLCSINWPNFIDWLPLLCEILGNMCIAIVCKPGCDVMNFEVKLIFLIKLFFLHNQNALTKTRISWERENLLRWNKKTFSIIFKGLSIKQITQIFLQGKSPSLRSFIWITNVRCERNSCVKRAFQIVENVRKIHMECLKLSGYP